jgi:hypothetical protein
MRYGTKTGRIRGVFLDQGIYKEDILVLRKTGFV